MKNITHCILMLLAAVCWLPYANANIREHVYLPGADELYCMYFDQKGLLWLGTSSGIKTYDGYNIKSWFDKKVPLYPQLISDIRSLTTDNANHLWAGTNNGLLRIDLTTGSVSHYVFPKQSQQIIYRLFTSADGTVYVGTDDGFSVYNSKTKQFRHYNSENAKAIYPNGKTGKYEGWGVKDFVEDANGDILIGTWEQGIWRYSPATGVIRAYARINERNSAYALCVDNKGRMWIGTSGYGVQRMDNTADFTAKTLRTVENFRGKRVVYDILQTSDGNMVVCSGDTIGANMGPDGALWLALREGGFERVLNDRHLFSSHFAVGVRSIFTDNGGQFYLGYSVDGLAWYDMRSKNLFLNNAIPGFSGIPYESLTTKVTSIVQRFNGDLWVAAGDNGIFIKHADGTSEVVYPNPKNVPYLKDNVIALYEDPLTKALWIGQRKGLSVLLPNNKGIALDVRNDSLDMTGYFMINNITSDHTGNIWVSSANRGIVRISGDPRNPKSLKYKHFNPHFSNITACFEDSKHRLWAICSGGLLLFNEDTEEFEIVNKSFHLADRQVLSINEDAYGCIWLATDKALVRLDSAGSTVSFTRQDGLPSTMFFPNSTFRFGDRLFFGTNKGLIDFVPKPSYNSYRSLKSSVIVTDILVDGSSVLLLDSLHMYAITKASPMTTREITIPASVRKFGIEFALLNYANQGETKYAYKLEEYDDDWKYVDGSTRCATYDHIRAGKYTFFLMAADSHGHWQKLPYSITVRVLSPWYASWWAYIIYMCIIAAMAYTIWKYISMLQELEASRRFSSIVMSTQIHPHPEGSTHHEAQLSDDNGNMPLAAKAAIAYRKRDAEFIAKATQLVLDNLSDADYNRDRMAADFNMSVSTLYGRMHECTGLSIQTFIQTIRLNASTEILANEPYIRINELAFRVGFNTPKYFSQCFKKKFGVLPGDYMKGNVS